MASGFGQNAFPSQPHPTTVSTKFCFIERTLLLLAVVHVLLKKLFDGCKNAEINEYVYTYPWKYLITSYIFLSNLSCMYAEV